MAEQNTGKITQIIGAVMDIKFSQGKIPEINEAIRVPLEDGGSLTVEVAQDLGDDTVRCIAMGNHRWSETWYGRHCNRRADFRTGW